MKYKDFKSIELLDEVNCGNHYTMSVNMVNDALAFTGYDFLADSDPSNYEYVYVLDKGNTELLLDCITQCEKYDYIGKIKENFSGFRGMEKLRKICEEKNIKYAFWSYNS